MKTQTTTTSIVIRTALTAAWLFCAANTRAQNGTWINLVGGNAGGSWTNAANWSDGVIATGTGNTADFSTLSLTTNSTVSLDGARTIGNLIFGNGTPSATVTNWLLNASSTNATTPAADALTLTVGSGAPVISVTNQIATINASVFGTNGFIKAGGGTLRLNGANTNATGTLGGVILVTNGDLQVGNVNAMGVATFVSGGASVVCTNGGTVEVINAIAQNNVLLYLGGTGNGGTNGALYANNPALGATSTRWGLTMSNVNSSAAVPAMILVTNASIRIDAIAGFNGFSNSFLAGYITSSTNPVVNVTNSNFILTKTGNGRLELERGAMVSNIVVQAGSVFPDSANGFNAVQYWTVQSGGELLNDQNQTFNASSITLEVDAGGLYDVNFRGTGVAGSDNNAYTQNLGTLLGAGTITCGERGEIAAQTLNINGTNNNSLFSGTITVTNGDTLNLGKTGAGTTLRLSGTNSYNGTTTVSAGTLLVNGAHTGGAAYTVGSGAVLGGTGSISAPVTLNSGTLLAGDGGGTLTVSNVLSGGGDTTIVSNASLTAIGALGSAASYLSTLYLTNATLTLPLLNSGPSAFASTLNNDGMVTLRYTNPNPTVGQFPFIAYSSLGGLAGGGTNGFTLVPPAGTTAYLSNNIANSSLDVVVSVIPALVWRGTPTGDWSIGGSANWLNGATPSAYTETAGQGPFVIFDDTAAGVSTVNLASSVTPKGITVSSSSKNYTYTGSGLINGSGSLEKDGTSTLTFANTSANAYSGTITINSGAVSVGNGGTAGNLGSATVVNSGSVIFNRSDNVTIGNAISGAGSLVNQGTGTVTLTGVGNVGGAVTVSAGTLALGPSGTITVSGDVTGNGAFGINGPGTVKLGSANVTYAGGTVITNGTLELDSAFPPSGNISDNGTLAVGVGGTLANNISGTGGVTLLAGATVTLGGGNTYSGPTVELAGATVNAAAGNYSSASALVLGNLAGGSDIGNANFTSGNPVLGGLQAGGNSSSPVNTITLGAGGQTLTVNGNVSIGNIAPVGASVGLVVTGTGTSFVVNTNGGTIQIGLGATSSGVNPDNVLVDLSGIDNFAANLGTAGLFNLGTLDGNPGPPNGATVVNQFKLAGVSNYISAGSLVIGAGGRQLIPEFDLGAGTNLITVSNLTVGGGGRDGGKLVFGGGTGGVKVRAYDGVSRASMNVGVNPATGTGASITNTVDFTGHPADLLLGSLIIGDYNNAGIYQCSFTFDTGSLDATSTSLSVLRNNNGANAAASLSALNINGGTASLGPVSLSASAAAGTLNINNAVVSVANITTTGSGTTTLGLDNATLNLSLTNNGNPATAPVAVSSFDAGDTVNLNVNGTNFVAGQFPLISYTGSIGGTGGYSSLNLTGLPGGVTGFISNNAANSSVDLVITSAPPVVNTNPTNITFSVSAGNQLNLSWPPDHKGWTLLTNSVGVTATNQWFPYPGSASLTNITISVNPGRSNVFFRLRYP